MTDNERNDKEDHDYKTAKVYCDRATFVHVSLKPKDNSFNNTFYNGVITEVSVDFFFILDRFTGKNHLVFFKELKKPIEEFTEAGQ